MHFYVPTTYFEVKRFYNEKTKRHSVEKQYKGTCDFLIVQNQQLF